MGNAKNALEIIPEKIAVGDKVRDLRKKLDLSQTDFCEKLGISTTLLSNIENGKRLPQIETALKLCELCPDISLDWLYGRAAAQDEESTLIALFAETFHFNVDGNTISIILDRATENFLKEVFNALDTTAANGLPDNIRNLWIEALKDNYRMLKRNIQTRDRDPCLRQYYLDLHAEGDCVLYPRYNWISDMEDLPF